MIADIAREWAGTPFVWGQSVKGEGCDCKGFVLGVLREAGWDKADHPSALFANYRADRPVPTPFLVEAFSELFDRVETMEAGDILLLNFQGHPGHMAIYLGEGKAIHAAINSVVRERSLETLTARFPVHSVWRCR